jgi:hypothetical protein
VVCRWSINLNKPPNLIVRSNQNRSSGHGPYIRTLRPRKKRAFNYQWSQPETGIKGAFSRRYKTFFTVFALVVTIGVISGLKIGVIYTSEAKLSVGAHLPRPLSDEGEHQAEPDPFIAKADALRELALIKSPTITRKTVDAVGISALYPDVWSKIQNPQLPFWMDLFSPILSSLGIKNSANNRDELIAKRKAWLIDGAHNRFLGSVKASQQADSNIISIKLRHKDPVIAVSATSELLRIYKEHRNELFGHKRQSEVFRPDREKYANLLKTADSDIEEYRKLHKITSLPQQISVHETQARTLKKEILNTETLLKANEAKLDDARQELALPLQEKEKPPANTATSQSKLSEMRETLAYLEETKENLARDPVTNRQDLRNIGDNITALKKYIEKQQGPATKVEAPTLNPARQNLEIKIRRLETDAVALRERLVSRKLDYEAAIDLLRSDEQLEKELNTLKMKREEALKKLEEQTELMRQASIRDDELQRSTDNISIIQSPTVSYPATNMAIVLMLISIPVGILLGLLTVRTLEYR